MLKELVIKDFAIIEDISISFKDGMSAILGETGAGKSIIIEAFSLLLGNRANLSMIREGKDKALVSATISFNNIPSELDDYKDSETNDFIFTRVLSREGNGSCKINGISVPSSVLKQTLAKKVNLHSQHDMFYLLDSKYHLSLLDKFSNNEINELSKEYKIYYQDYLKLTNEYEDLKNKSNDIDIEYIRYQLEEIEKIDVKENEYEEIEKELSRYNKFDKIASSVNGIVSLFDDEEGINDLLYKVKKYYSQLSSDEGFSKYEESFISSLESLDEFVSNIKDEFSSLDYDENNIELLKNRQFEINKLRRKYGDYKDIIQVREEFRKQIEFYDDKDYYLNKLETNIQISKDKAYKSAYEISNIRKKYAHLIEDSVTKELKDLYLDRTLFKIEFSETCLTSLGIDKVEFKIATNVGESLKPLISVVSGGEASRITLALNVVFNKIYDIDLAIFDEIDSGVSGKVATSMGRKMKDLSSSYQVLTISHLPQVLGFSNNFYYIGKEIINNRTRSFVKDLDKNDRVIEIAKILSGSDMPSDKFIENAKDLLIE